MKKTASIPLLILTLCACGPSTPPQAFLEAWQAAARAHDGAAAWALIDQASRERIVAALGKSHDRAAKDAPFAALAGACLAPAQPAMPSEQMATTLVGAELAGATAPSGASVSDKQVTAGGRTAALHFESGAWRGEAKAFGFVDDTGAPACVSIVLPGAGDPPPPAAALATSARAAVPARKPFTGDPKSLAPVEEIVTRQKTEKGTVLSVIHNAGGKTLDYTNSYEGKKDFLRVDLVKHEQTARGGDKVMTFRLTDDNKELAANRWHRTYAVVMDGGKESWQVRETEYFDDNGGSRRLIQERADDRNPAVIVVHERKDAKGEDLAKLNADDRDKALIDKARWSDGPTLSIKVHVETPEQWAAAVQRAAELAQLDGVAAGQVRALAMTWDGRIGHDDVADVTLVLTPGKPALSAILGKLDGTEERTPALSYTPL